MGREALNSRYQKQYRPTLQSYNPSLFVTACKISPEGSGPHHPYVSQRHCSKRGQLLTVNLEGSRPKKKKQSQTYYTAPIPKMMCHSFSNTQPTPKSSVNSVVAAQSKMRR